MYGFLGASYLRETSSVRGFPGNCIFITDKYLKENRLSFFLGN